MLVSGEGECGKGLWRGSKTHVLYLPAKYCLIGHVFPTKKPPERGRTFERIRIGREPDPLEPPTPVSQFVGGARRTVEHRLEYSTLFWRFLAAPRTYHRTTDQAGLVHHCWPSRTSDVLAAALRCGPGVTVPFVAIEIVFFRYASVVNKRQF